MKKYMIATLASFLAAGAAWASPWFLYLNKDAIEKGEWTFQVGTEDGVLVPAAIGLKSADQVILGSMDGLLYQAELSRLDNEVKAAIIKPGEAIQDEKLIALHEKRAERLTAFLPAPEAESTGLTREEFFREANEKAEKQEEAKLDADVYDLLINGVPLGDEPVALSKKYKEAEFRLEVVNKSTNSVWGVKLEMEGDPDISFWKKGRQKGLNSVPRRTLQYYYQGMFRPLKSGDMFGVPVEAFFIKEDRYWFTVRLESKIGDQTFEFPVIFEEEKTN